LPPSVPVIRPGIKLKYQLLPSVFRTRLRRTNELMPTCRRPKLLQHTFDYDKALQTATKEESAALFRQWLESVPPPTLIVYSDGSKSTDGAAGYGFVVHQHGETVLSGSGRLGPAEVFDAEAKGALEGLRAALSIQEAPRNDVVVCLDNLAAVACLRGNPSDSSQDVFLDFQSLAKSHGATEVRWVPGHTDIPGNEQADVLAKAGTILPEPPDQTPTLAYLRSKNRRMPSVCGGQRP
jgi:ribonuclease HI